MQKQTIGFNYIDKITTEIDYLSVKVILQGTLTHQTYSLLRTAAYEYELDIDSTAFLQGTYNRFYVGVLANREEIVKEDHVYFEANPENAYKKVSFYEKLVENIDKYLLEPDSIRHQAYTIAGRSITRWSITELTSLRERYIKKVMLEKKGINTSIPPKSITYRF